MFKALDFVRSGEFRSLSKTEGGPLIVTLCSEDALTYGLEVMGSRCSS